MVDLKKFIHNFMNLLKKFMNKKKLLKIKKKKLLKIKQKSYKKIFLIRL